MHDYQDRITLKEKICFGFGDLASVLYWQTFMLYITFFYTDVFLLPAGIAATMFLVSRAFDAITDPVMGMIADRTQTKHGKFRPYLLWMCVPLAVTGVFTFSVPDLGENGKIIYAYITFFAIMLMYTAINIPFNCMLGVITPDTDERTSVSSIKFIFAFTAGIVVSATLLPLVLYFGDMYAIVNELGETVSNTAKGWQMTFVVYGIAAVIFFLITFKGTKERVQPPKSQHNSVKKDIRDLVTNKPWLILFSTTLLFIFFAAIKSSVTVHYFRYVIGSQELNLPFFSGEYGFEAIVSGFNTIGQISSLIGALILPFVSKRIGKKETYIVMLFVALVAQALLYFPTADELGLIFGLQILGSLASGALPVVLWAMYADTADYAEWKTGGRATGLIFSASTMSQKFGWAFGAYLALTLMAQFGFQPNVEQSADSMGALVLLFSVIPALFALLSILMCFFYPLNELRMHNIVNELHERRLQRDEPEMSQYK